MNEQQYSLIQPYYKYIETEQCHTVSICGELATLHEAFGFGYVNRTCGGCIADMMKRLNAFRLEYEGRK